MDAYNLHGKVAIITGAASGIGRSVALLFARRGVGTVVSDVSTDGGQETVDLIKDGGGDAIYIQADVSNPNDNESLVAKTMEVYGRLDYAVNNAGIGGESNKTADYSIEGWRRVLSINLDGVFYGLKYQIPAMLKTGAGAVVNMTSILGQVAFSQAPAYVTAKHGVVGLTRAAALDYAAAGIRINSVGPAFISTPLISYLEEDREANQMLISLHPIGRLGTPDEVANLVVWLCSDEASFITGAYYPVDGGYLAR